MVDLDDGMARCDSALCTWWHHNGVINRDTSMPVAAHEVRMSSHYIVEVRRVGRSGFRHSFTYEAVPRNGKGRAFAPWDPPRSNTLNETEDDGVSDVEMELGTSMAWSSFLYKADVEGALSGLDPMTCGLRHSPDPVAARRCYEYSAAHTIDIYVRS